MGCASSVSTPHITQVTAAKVNEQHLNDRRDTVSTPVPSPSHQSHPMSPSDDAKVTSHRIDEQLKLERLKPVIKVLLLGGAESGKTTIFKQMKILHMNGFTQSDLNFYTLTIHSNIISAMNQLIAACERHGIIHDSDIQMLIQNLNEFLRDNSLSHSDIVLHRLPPSIGDIISRIWCSSSVQCVFKQHAEYHLADNAQYFLDQVVRLTDLNYVPNDADILHCRYRTTGIHEISFKYKDLTLRMIDVGGQKSERRKWLHVFDNVALVLFIVALAPFDRTDPEEDDKNRLVVSLEIYSSIIQTSHFIHSTIILFLNKKDLFKESIKRVKLTTAFPDYCGDNSYEDAIGFIKNKFTEPLTRQKTEFFPFTTTATDTDNISKVFDSAISHIININVKNTAL